MKINSEIKPVLDVEETSTIVAALLEHSKLFKELRPEVHDKCHALAEKLIKQLYGV